MRKFLRLARDKLSLREHLRIRNDYRLLAHDHRHATIEPYFPVPDIHANDEDVAIASRILRAYHAAKEEEQRSSRPGDDVWAEILTLQSAYLAVLDRGDAHELAAYLCNMCRTDATHGTAQGHYDHRRLAANSSYRRIAALMVKDKLLLFAEALGVIDVENPESGKPGTAFQRSSEVLLESLSDYTGLDLTPPDIDGGLFKLQAGKAKIHERDLHGQFLAFSLLNAADVPEHATICEIGGGVGRLAYWAHRFGAKQYALLDLPHINVLQSYYLLRALPNAKFQLFGEAPVTRPHFRVLPYFAKQCLDDQHFDLIVNVDSFPEIEALAVQDYLEWIKGHGTTFVSVNHEQNLARHSGPVRDMVSRVGGFECISREPYWLRKGYVRERYRTT